MRCSTHGISSLLIGWLADLSLLHPLPFPQPPTLPQLECWLHEGSELGSFIHDWILRFQIGVWHIVSVYSVNTCWISQRRKSSSVSPRFRSSLQSHILSWVPFCLEDISAWKQVESKAWVFFPILSKWHLRGIWQMLLKWIKEPMDIYDLGKSLTLSMTQTLETGISWFSPWGRDGGATRGQGLLSKHLDPETKSSWFSHLWRGCENADLSVVGRVGMKSR